MLKRLSLAALLALGPSPPTSVFSEEILPSSQIYNMHSDPLSVIPLVSEQYINDETNLGFPMLKEKISQLISPPMNYPFTLKMTSTAAQLENYSDLESLALSAKNNYMILGRSGNLIFFHESMILDPKGFNEFSKLYHDGFLIQKIGFFDEGLKIPKRHAQNFHFGKNLKDSFIEEIIGVSKKQDLPEKLQEFAGFPTSRLYRVNQLTMNKSALEGYIFNIYYSMISSPVNGETVPVLFKWHVNSDGTKKEIIPTTTGSVYYTNSIIKNLQPNKLIILPGNNQQNLKPYFLIQNFVIGEGISTVGDWINTRDHKFPAKFDEPIYILGVNKK